MQSVPENPPAAAQFASAQPVSTNNFTRLAYDGCETRERVARSTGPGRYVFSEADLQCGGCYTASPKMRLQTAGVSQVAHYGRTDVESDLFNIDRSSSRCATKEYQPARNAVNRDNLRNMPECNSLATYADSRLSNPPANLRGTGVNRFEWPCIDPQAHTELPFDYFVQARMVAKDTHRPCIPKPIDITPSLPMAPFPAGPRPVAVADAAKARMTPPPPAQVACLNSPGGPAAVAIGLERVTWHGQPNPAQM